MNVQVLLRAVKPHKIYNLSKSANSKKIPHMLRIDDDYPVGHPKGKFCPFKNCKAFHRKTYFT